MQLTIDTLSIARGGRTILEKLSFGVAGGEALLLTGPNGVGKTTLLRTLAGLLAPAAGQITFEGGAPEQEIGEQCHFIGHLNGIKLAQTVADNLLFWSEFLGSKSSPAAIGPALARLELDRLADIPAGYLSAGQKRRLGLARLLVAPRAIWLLDEPTASLDAASTAAFTAIASGHVASGGMLVAATHLPLAIGNARELALGPVEAGA